MPANELIGELPRESHRSEVRCDTDRPAEELLRAFMQAYWLRPENALWMALRSWALTGVELGGRSADISCGDGIFTFLHLGGRFHSEFDVFQSAGNLERVRGEHADMFDCEAPAYSPGIVTPSQDTITYGTDLKPNLLHKAEQLGVYERLIQANNNEKLPFDDDSLTSIYCNSAYWVENVDGFLAELARVIQPNGSVVLHVKLDCMRDYTLETYAPQLGRSFLDIIGRGRLSCWPTLGSRMTWERRFAQAGFTIASAIPFVTKTHAHIWDVGLRPFAPMLVKMANAVVPNVRAEVKSEWVDLCTALIMPFADPTLDLTCDNEPAEVQYVLTPQF